MVNGRLVIEPKVREREGRPLTAHSEQYLLKLHLQLCITD